jgi:hypothetical protein
MAYLDDRRSVNVWILGLTIPALALFGLGWLSTIAVDSTSVLMDVQAALESLSSVTLISPLFVLIQFSMLVRGTANTTWQNLLCVGLTIAGAIMAWSSRLGG